ncbi:hypothetical protein MBLNU230_g3636t1 [Neophaeotheca triangularis]
MNGTPRMRSAFPASPEAFRGSDRYGRSPRSSRMGQQAVPDVPTLKPQAAKSDTDPWIPFYIIDAPAQRLYAVAIYTALMSYKAYDFFAISEAEEESFWLFIKWIALDGIFLFTLPSFRIPWLELSSAVVFALFMGHAAMDAMLMFRIPLPLGAVFAGMTKSLYGIREMALDEERVNPNRVLHNDSLILGRQIIHILPEGSAVLNKDRDAFCLGDDRIEAMLPITINATNPISIDIIRIDLETEANETISLGKSQIKSMHKAAARYITYSDKENEPKTLYHPVKKPGLYVLGKVMDETNLEVRRKQFAHTVVVPCPKAAVKQPTPNKCKGDLSDVELEVTGTPPLRVKYRKTVNQAMHESSFESIQPDDFSSPLGKHDQGALVVPNKIDVEWARPQTIPVPLVESLGISGRWAYSIDEVRDGFGNVVDYMSNSNEDQKRHASQRLHLQQVIQVHERPTVNLDGRTPRPLKIAKGSSASLPVQYSSTGKGDLGVAYHIEFAFTPQSDLSATGGQSANPQHKSMTAKSPEERAQINEPGLYSLTKVSSDYCAGEVLEPSSLLLQNPPEPDLAISTEEIFDKCAGSPIGLRVDLDLIGTPPFEVRYRMKERSTRHHVDAVEHVKGMRGQLELTPNEAGHYTYEFLDVSDSVYRQHSLLSKDLLIEQDVKPSAHAFFKSRPNRPACIDDKIQAEIVLQGEGPFSIEYELVHNGKRQKRQIDDIHDKAIAIETDNLKDGGDYTLALVSVTDKMGCKEFLKEEYKVSVKHQKPKVGFGHIEGHRSVNTLEGKDVQLPIRLAGEAPWTVMYMDSQGHEHSLTANRPNDLIRISEAGTYHLIGLRDSICPGQVDEQANRFDVSWIARPELRVSPNEVVSQKGNTLMMQDVCEGEEDAVEVLFKGTPPYHLQYVQQVKPEHGAIAPKNKDLRAALNAASLRLDTAQAGLYEYKLSKLSDANYAHSSTHFTPMSIQQRVNSRPSAAFTHPGKTYSFCSAEASGEGEEKIPITLHGTPPFDLEVEVKHHGSAKPDMITVPSIASHSTTLHLPHRSLHQGKSAVSLRRVSDAKSCSRLLDSTTPRVQVSVHDAPTITPLETTTDYCVGDRLNFALSGIAPFTVYYDFNGHSRKATASGTTFRRLAEKPGTFTITGLTDSASNCKAHVHLTKEIHGMPSALISKGRDSYVDIHEGSQTEILFEFGGVPPFEFTWTRSSNVDTKKRGKGVKAGEVLDMRSEISEEYAMSVVASEEGTYEVVAIKDRYCSYSKPGHEFGGKGKGQKRLGYV